MPKFLRERLTRDCRTLDTKFAAANLYFSRLSNYCRSHEILALVWPPIATFGDYRFPGRYSSPALDPWAKSPKEK